MSDAEKPKKEKLSGMELPADEIDDKAWAEAMESLAKKEGRKIRPLPYKR